MIISFLQYLKSAGVAPLRITVNHESDKRFRRDWVSEWTEIWERNWTESLMGKLLTATNVDQVNRYEIANGRRWHCKPITRSPT